MRNDFIAHSAKGTTWRKKGAKYIERVWKNGKWRYYYKKAKTVAKQVVNRFQKAYDKLKSIKLKDIKVSKESQDKIDSVLENHGSESLSKFDYNIRKSKWYKYFSKIKLADGKYRYFYSQDEYNRYLNRKNILSKDYEYMQDVPVLDKKKTPAQIAKDVDIGTDNGNCGSCSLAFELQMRGYDVKSRADIDGMAYSEWGINSFKGFESKAGTKYNWYFDTTKKENSEYYGKGFLGLKATSEEEKLQMVKSDLERSIIERGGENQRGFMTINWTQTDPDENGQRHNSGGGHIFNYVAENGTVKFYDSQKGEKNNQTGGEIDITEYLDNTSYLAHRVGSDGGPVTYCSFFRVDDKDISEQAKNYVSYEPIEIHDEPEWYEIYTMDNTEKKRHG